MTDSDERGIRLTFQVVGALQAPFLILITLKTVSALRNTETALQKRNQGMPRPDWAFYPHPNHRWLPIEDMVLR